MCSRGGSSAKRGGKTQDRPRTGARTALLHVLTTANHVSAQVPGVENWPRLWWEESHGAVCHKALWTGDTHKPPDSVARERWGQANAESCWVFNLKHRREWGRGGSSGYVCLEIKNKSFGQWSQFIFCIFKLFFLLLI